jgi:ribosomal protein L11 methyltransferase
VTLDLPARLEDQAIAGFWEAGCLGVQGCAPGGRATGWRSADARAGPPRVTLEAWFPGRTGTEAIRRRVGAGLAAAGIRPAPRSRLRRVADGRWVAAWQKSLRPMPIGRRLLALPEGCRGPAPGRRIVIRIPFGQAFGTGEHATTRLTLRLLERLLRPGDRVVDLGTGTGILAVAAARLGAGRVLAVDDDPVAVRVARATLARNRPVPAVTLRTADAADALTGDPFDLALVNIGATVIRRILPSLERALAPGGHAVLSGILVEDEAPLARAARAAGLVTVARRRSAPWSALVVRRAARP